MTVVFIASLLLNAALFVYAIRMSKRLLQFDELFNVIDDDMGKNINFMDDMLSRPLMSQAPEVRALDHNLRKMRLRMMQVAGQISNHIGTENELSEKDIIDTFEKIESEID